MLGDGCGCVKLSFHCSPNLQVIQGGSDTGLWSSVSHVLCVDSPHCCWFKLLLFCYEQLERVWKSQCNSLGVEMSMHFEQEMYCKSIWRARMYLLCVLVVYFLIVVLLFSSLFFFFSSMVSRCWHLNSKRMCPFKRGVQATITTDATGIIYM